MGWKIPFDKDGNQHTGKWGKVFQEFDNYEFKDLLQYVGYERGQSSLNIRWRGVYTGKTYLSGMTMLHEVLLGNIPNHASFTGNGVLNVEGKFGFKKQGTSVLLKLV